jgi:hydrogenase nickel incorporation protein HypB
VAERVEVREGVLKENDRIAAELREALAAKRTLCLNLISSPGAGKTSILEGTLEALRATPLRAAVLTGDIQTERDADRLKRYGFPALQITTGGTCHLDASMVRRSLTGLPPDDLDVLFIENVGNLVCPASYDLGEDAKVVVLSVAEGDDKPLKYPGIFRRARLMLLHKIDLLPYTRFNRDAAVADARRVNPEIEVVETSCLGEPGLEAWLRWIDSQLAVKRKTGRPARG